MRPPIISLASTKGGVGKTTIAFCLATELARRGRGGGFRVSCVDADPNLTLHGAVRRGKPAGVEVEVADSATIMEAMNRAADRGGVVLVDLQGSANQAMLYACGKSDLVLIPTKPSQFDVMEALKTAQVVAQASDLTRRKIEARVVLSQTPVLRQRVAEHSRTQLEGRGLPMLSVELMDRTAFRVMSYSGKPPADENPGSAAARNVAALASEVAAIIGLPLTEEGKGA